MSDQSLTIRVSRSTHELLRGLATSSKATISALVDEAVRDLQRKKFWADFNAGYAALKADPKAWADLQQENAAWDSTLADGLPEEKADADQRDRSEARRGLGG